MWSPQGKEARKVFRKVMKAFRDVVFALTNQETTRTKGRGKDQKERVRKVLRPNLEFQPRKIPVKKDMAMPSNPDGWLVDCSTSATGWSCTRAHTAWMASVPLNLANHPTHVVVDLGCTRSTVHTVTPEPDAVLDEDVTAMHLTSSSVQPTPTAEQRGRTRRDERSRSRERVPPRSSSLSSQQPQLVVPLQEFSRPSLWQLKAQMKIQQPWIHKIA